MCRRSVQLCFQNVTPVLLFLPHTSSSGNCRRRCQTVSPFLGWKQAAIKMNKILTRAHKDKNPSHGTTAGRCKTPPENVPSSVLVKVRSGG